MGAEARVANGRTPGRSAGDLPGADCTREHRGHGPPARADPHEAARRAQGLAEALGMGDRLDTRVQRLSLGTRQKIGLISALSHEPTVAILDEPTNGLDPLAIVAFRNEVRRLAAAGRSILLTSHHFDELARIADHVDILHRGRIIDTVTPDGRDLEKVFFDRVVASDLADRELA